jgi:hypothetical protein
MTAIVSTYVPGQGFAVGADSLRIDAKTGVVVTENARKIFLIEGHGLRLVYAWAGASSLFLGDGQEFSFVDESANIGNAIATDKPESMGQYVGQFAARIHTDGNTRTQAATAVNEHAVSVHHQPTQVSLPHQQRGS